MFAVKHISNKNPLLNHIHVFNEVISCRICPNLGASIQELSFNNIDVINGIYFSDDGLESYTKAYQSAILFPFVGRIPNGEYNYNSKIYKLETNEENCTNALHGLVYNKHFILDHCETSSLETNIQLSYNSDGSLKGFPFKFKFQVNYLITERGITINFNIINQDSSSFPFGCGWHPYFKSNNLASSSLSFTSKEKLVCNKDLIPIGITSNKESSTFKVKNKKFDDTFILLKNEINFETNNYQLHMTFNETKNNFLQVYTPIHRKSIALEPVTCTPNAFNNKNGLLELKPNEHFSWSINLKIKTYE